MIDRDEIVNEIIKAAGSQRALAAMLGLTHVAIHYWKRVPVRHVITLERAFDGRFPRHKIRPDYYPLQ